MNDDERPRIVVHEQISVTERRSRPQGLRETANFKNRPSYAKARRNWHTSNDDKDMRFPKFSFHVPQWLMPKNGVHRFCTITASIVWGLAGAKCQEQDDNTRTLAICL